MKSNYSLLGGVIFLCSVLLSGCGSKEEVVKKEVVRPVEIYSISDSSSRYIQNFPALVAPSDESELSFRVSGELVELKVVSGSKVKKGDIIAQIDPTDFIVKVKEAKATHNLALKTFERQKKMLSLELTSQAEYDLALADMQYTQYRLEAARNNLTYTTLRAPFDGLISSTKVENREIVKASQSIVNLHATEGIDVTFQMPESILTQVNLDAARSYQPKVHFTSSVTHRDTVYRAHFKEMDRDVDLRSRTYKVTLTMKAPDGFVIVPGMTASVKLELDQIIDGSEQYYLVPVESVFSPTSSDPENKQYAVWVIDRETMMVNQQMITIDGITDEGVRVVSGLNEGDAIAAAGVHSLLDGMKVSEWKKQRGI